MTNRYKIMHVYIFIYIYVYTLEVCKYMRVCVYIYIYIYASVHVIIKFRCKCICATCICSGTVRYKMIGGPAASANLTGCPEAVYTSLRLLRLTVVVCSFSGST